MHVLPYWCYFRKEVFLTACDDFFDMLVIAPKYNVRSLVLLILVIVALLARERSALATLIASRRVCGFVIMSFCLSVCLSVWSHFQNVSFPAVVVEWAYILTQCSPTWNVEFLTYDVGNDVISEISNDYFNLFFIKIFLIFLCLVTVIGLHDCKL